MAFGWILPVLHCVSHAIISTTVSWYQRNIFNVLLADSREIFWVGISKNFEYFVCWYQRMCLNIPFKCFCMTPLIFTKTFRQYFFPTQVYTVEISSKDMRGTFRWEKVSWSFQLLGRLELISNFKKSQQSADVYDVLTTLNSSSLSSQILILSVFLYCSQLKVKVDVKSSCWSWQILI